MKFGENPAHQGNRDARFFREGETVDLKVIKMDVENRRIVLSITERLKEFGQDAIEEFTKSHPRLEDVVAADQSSEGKTETLPGDEDLAAEAAAYAQEAEDRD